jgi:hypothetical protein
MNIISENAPIKAAGLQSELKFNNSKELAKDILNAYTREHEEIFMASAKVRGVI